MLAGNCALAERGERKVWLEDVFPRDLVFICEGDSMPVVTGELACCNEEKIKGRG